MRVCVFAEACNCTAQVRLSTCYCKHVTLNHISLLLQEFDPALNNLLQHPDWDTWSRKLLPRYFYDPELVSPAVESHTVWFEQLKAKRAAAEAAKAAAAAEAAAAQAAAEQEDREREAAAEAAAKSGQLEAAGSKRGCIIM
jgi:hypothetical protein